MSSPYHISIDSTNGTRVVTEIFLGYQGKVSIYNSANTFIYTYDVDYDVQPTYINEDYDYLFIPIYNEDKIYVFSTNYDTPLFELTGFSGPNSVAFDPINDRTYVVNSNDNTISVLDSGTLSEIGLLGVSDCYLGNIVYDSFNQLMIVTGNLDGVISKIDINT
jgi:YVTN family beta-propeller protein